MKRNIFLICISLFLSINLNAQDTNKVYAKINKVTIYNSQAQVEKSIEVSLKKGFNEFILAGNSNKLETQSIQFNNSNDFMIMEFSPYSQVVRADKVAEEKLSEASRKRVKILKDSIELLVYKQIEVNNILSVLNKEKTALENMKVVSNSSAIDSIGKIREGLIYFRDKMTEVNSMIQKKEKEVYDLKQVMNIVKSNLSLILQGNEQENSLEKSETYIKVNLYCEKSIENAKLEYRYITERVRWNPFYDVKFTTNKDSIELALKANLIQYTQEDWNDVKLVFSTEEPNNQGNISEITPIYYSIKPKEESDLDFSIKGQDEINGKDIADIEDISEEDEINNGMVEQNKVKANNNKYSDELENNLPPPPALKSSIKFTAPIIKKDREVLAASLLGKDYQVSMNYTIKNNDNSKIIPLETKYAKINYKYYSVPKNEKVVYLSALIPNWEDLELMGAEAKIYVDNNYVSETWINPLQTNDTLSISVGKEKRVAINRKSTNTKPEKVGIMGNNVETIFTITIDVKNNTQSPINIDIADQIPLSNTESITITPIDKANAKYDEKTGKLNWDLSLKALEARTITFTYSVRYPKDKEIILN